MYNAKNCDLNLSVEWSHMFFRNSMGIMNINEGTREFCMPSGALVCFSERHMTWDRIHAFYYEV